jgi:hypothetical protein
MSPIPTHATPRNGGEQPNLFGSSVLTVPSTSIFGLSVILPQQRACAACGSVEAKNTPGELEHEAPLTAWPDALIGSGRNHLSYIDERGRGFEALDQHRRSLGVHRDMRSAANAVETAAAPLPTKRDGPAALRAACRARREASP